MSLNDLQINPRAWPDANCVGLPTSVFYPTRGETTEPAKQVCQACSCRQECLEYAIARAEKFGIWGGQSERARREIRRQRAHARAAATSGGAA